MTRDPLEPDFKFICTHTSFLLKALLPLSKQESIVAINHDGIRFITSLESSSSQIMSYLSLDLFSSFQFKQETNLSFSLDLSGLIEILGMLSNHESENNKHIIVTFNRVDCELHLSFVNAFDGMDVECSLLTYDSELANVQVIEAFHDSACCCKIIIKSEWLKNALVEIDTSVQQVIIAVSSSAPYFRISGIGMQGEVQIDYPSESIIFDSFECLEPCQFSYNLSILMLCFKALSTSVKTCLRFNQQGILDLQFMMTDGVSEKTTFIEFAMLPIQDL